MRIDLKPCLDFKDVLIPPCSNSRTANQQSFQCILVLINAFCFLFTISVIK